jgi:UPF0176 protein
MDASSSFVVAAFYRFQPMAGLTELRDKLLAACQAAEARGILLVAPEGINGTIAAPAGAMEALLEAIRAIAGLDALEPRRSISKRPPFKRMKVRIKREIVTMGDAACDASRLTGRRVAPEDWDALIAEPDVLLIDARNAFEIAFGSFEGAVDPGTASFGEFPDWARRTLDPARHRRIAMFCTGGIRCEKASSLLLRAGFAEVSQLEGGILNYLERRGAAGRSAGSRWRGGCFVFDERVALGPELKPLGIGICLSCDAPLDAAAKAGEGYEEGVSCPRCVSRLSEAQKASARERQRQLARPVPA